MMIRVQSFVTLGREMSPYLPRYMRSTLLMTFPTTTEISPTLLPPKCEPATVDVHSHLEM